ncbi:hypothetical protein K458DRAFT_358012 [Lentithecium fluviatile CBS 122367]|uniref:Copper acquisition factor BIM1-like domain-containing protein n=1 Tax=Lentithecium fluviatile CBS 122367 TaxID=1168545 RepID=A0A6G1JGF7_9PLEO|nr:hypothetical protein K458DRAFT_358012 [Lentithecium fluviatile CBS 122367]
MLSNALSLFALLPLTSAHFLLTWPTARGFDDANAGSFPCGSFDSVSSNRTDFPMSGGPLQLDMHHSQTRVAVYMAIGDNPGSNYSIQLRQQFEREGLGDFCLGMVSIPSDLNISAGTKATIQVVTNGDPDGGLYQVREQFCADVTLTDAALSQSDYDSHCKNGTGNTGGFTSGYPNQTSDASASATSSAAGSSASPTTGAASHATAVPWVLGVVGAVAFGML